MDDTFGNTPEFQQNTEPFRAMQNDSEPDGNVPYDSASFRTVPNTSEPIGNVPHRSERTEHHTLTVRDAARMFESADVARTERSITNWCQPDRNGVSRLDCYLDQNEHRWYITRQSVERAIQEEQAKAGFEHDKRSSEESEPVPNRAEAPKEPPNKEEEAATQGTKKIEKLEGEVRDLSIATRVKDLYIKRVEDENAQLRENLKEYIDQLIQLNRHSGRLEGMLGLPEPHTSGDGTHVIDAAPAPQEARKHSDPSTTHTSEQNYGAPENRGHRESPDRPQDEPPPSQRETSPHDPVSIRARSLSESSSYHSAYENPSQPSPESFQDEERDQ